MVYRRKLDVIEAFKYDGDFAYSDGTRYTPIWLFDALNNGTLYYKDDGDLFMKTLEEDVFIAVGDYIIQGKHGELRRCKQGAFEAMYEPVYNEEPSK